MEFKTVEEIDEFLDKIFNELSNGNKEPFDKFISEYCDDNSKSFAIYIKENPSRNYLKAVMLSDHEKIKNNFDLSLELLFKEVENGNFRAYKNIGNIYEHYKKDKENAIKYWILCAEKGFIDGYINCGWLKYNDNENEEAIKYYEMAIDNGYTTESYYYLGEIYHKRLKNNDKALEYYLLDISCNSLNNTELRYSYYHIGEIYSCRNDFNTANKYYATAAERGLSFAYYDIGSNYSQIGLDDQAVYYYKRYIERSKNPDLKLVYDSIANSYSLLDNITNCIKYSKMAIEEGNINSYYYLINSYIYSGDFISAKENIMILHSYGNKQVYGLLGKLYEVMGDDEKSLYYYNIGVKNGDKKCFADLHFYYYNKEIYHKALKYMVLIKNNFSDIKLKQVNIRIRDVLGMIKRIHQDYERSFEIFNSKYQKWDKIRKTINLDDYNELCDRFNI